MIGENNKSKGRFGLTMAIAYYGYKGYTISVPLNDTQDYDIVIDDEERLQKVQVKCTGSLDEYGIYHVSLKSSGGTKGKLYKRVKDTKIDRVFVVCTNGWMFDIPMSAITQKSVLPLCDRKTNPTGEDYSKYLAAFSFDDPKVTINKVKKPVVNKRVKKKSYCIDCGKELSSPNHQRCLSCHNKQLKSAYSWVEKGESNRPTEEELAEYLKNRVPFSKLARLYNVSDNTVRKWCRKYGLPYTRIEIEKWLQSIDIPVEKV